MGRSMIETELRPYPSEGLKETMDSCEGWVLNLSGDSSVRHYRRFWIAILGYWSRLEPWETVDLWKGA